MRMSQRGLVAGVAAIAGNAAAYLKKTNSFAC